MQTTVITAEATPSKAALWTGRILMVLLILFLLFDAIGKVLLLKEVVDTSAKVGWSANMLRPLGITLLLCTIFYSIPRTTLFGAILLTAYLGGATATNIVAGFTGFSMIFPIIFGILVWVGLLLTHSRHRTSILSTFR